MGKSLKIQTKKMTPWRVLVPTSGRPQQQNLQKPQLLDPSSARFPRSSSFWTSPAAESLEAPASGPLQMQKPQLLDTLSRISTRNSNFWMPTARYSQKAWLLRQLLSKALFYFFYFISFLLFFFLFSF